MRKGSRVTPAFLVLLVILAGGCGGNELCLTCPTSDTIPPNIMLESPKSGTAEVPVTDTIKVTFSEPVNPATVNTSTFVFTRVASANSTANVTTAAVLMRGEITVSGATVTFTPDEELECFTRYRVKITTGVKDMAGNSLNNDYEWEFTTAQDPTLWKLDEGYQANHIAVNATGRYVTGRTENPDYQIYKTDFFTARFNLNGERDWLEEVVTEDFDTSCGIAVNGNSVFVGRMEDPLGLGDADIYVDARDANTGALLWSTLVGAHTICRDIDVDETSVYIVTTGNVFKLDVENGNVKTVLPNENVGGLLTTFHSVTVDANSVYIGGQTNRDLIQKLPDGAGGWDFFVVSYDKKLQNQQWLSQWGDLQNQRNPDLALLSDAGLVYLVGFSGISGDSTNVTALIAFDLANGEFRWVEDLPADGLPSITSDGSEALYTTLGEHSETPLKLSSDGDIVWTASPPLKAVAVAVNDGMVFVVDNTNVVSCYDAETGIRH